MDTTKRESWIDMARALAMILVVAGHCVELLAYTPWATTLRDAIYIGHLPLFFVISGYLFKSNVAFKPFIKKLFHAILIPYFCCAFILLDYNIVCNAISSLINHTAFAWGEIVETVVYYLTQKRYATIWFLSVLFLGEIFYWIINHFCDSKKIKYTLCLILGLLFMIYDSYFAGYGNHLLWLPDRVIAKPMLWNIDTAFISLVFLSFGDMLKEYDIFHRFFNSKKNTIINMSLYFVAAMALFMVQRTAGYPTLEMWGGYYGIIPLTILSAIAMAMAIMLFSRLIKDNSMLILIGQNTFVIFAFHKMIGIDIAMMFINAFSLNTPELTGAICSLSVMILCVIICTLVFGYTLHYTGLDFMVGKREK